MYACRHIQQVQSKTLSEQSQGHAYRMTTVVLTVVPPALRVVTVAPLTNVARVKHRPELAPAVGCSL